MRYADILSFGAGVNSVALAILAINDGWRGEIVFSDTGCEWPETMCYLDYFKREWLQPRSFEVMKLGPKQTHQSDKKIGAYSLIEYCEKRAIIPFPAMRWCTINWKVLPVEKLAGGKSQMLGIAADEAHRKVDAIRPLVEAGVDREGCIEIIKAEGLDVPQKSGCFICPFQRNDQWRMLWERHPDLFDQALILEEASTKRRGIGKVTTFDPAGKITLRQRKLAYESQMELPEIDMDDLLRFKPCVCTL